MYVAHFFQPMWEDEKWIITWAIEEDLIAIHQEHDIGRKFDILHRIEQPIVDKRSIPNTKGMALYSFVFSFNKWVWGYNQCLRWQWWVISDYNKNFHLLSIHSMHMEVTFLGLHAVTLLEIIVTTLDEYDDHYGYTLCWFWGSLETLLGHDG